MNTGKRFQRRIEEFSCGKCGANVAGNGYTNHCPKCLWSRHVDVFPGDRAASCEGLMEPVSAFFVQGEWRLVHRCIVCRHEKKNRLSDEDDREILREILERGSRS